MDDINEKPNSTRVDFSPVVLSPHEKLIQQMGMNNDPEISADHPAGGELNANPDEQELLDRVEAALRTIYDPEIPVNIYDLGLIYRVEIIDKFAKVDMTLTAPGCPVAHTFPGMVEGTVKLVPGIEDAEVELVWDPPWRQEMISEAARLELGLL